RRKRTGY
ncbi:yjeF-related family protein, partial [Vibrio parahaemolyticus EKP-021]